MSKKNLGFLISGIVVLIIVIVYIAQIYPPKDGLGGEGTIGKVEKYRKQQVTAKDIVLSDNLLKDTIALKNTFEDMGELAYFALETNVLITKFWIPELSANWTDNEGKEIIKNLEDFSTFLENNVSKISEAQQVLYKIYLGKEQNVKEDVGARLANFVNFVIQMLERDSIIDNTIQRIENKIKTYPQNNLSKELLALRKLRDRIVVDNFLYGVAIGDSKKIEYTSNLKLYDVAGSVKGLIEISSYQKQITNQQNFIVKSNEFGKVYCTNFLKSIENYNVACNFPQGYAFVDPVEGLIKFTVASQYNLGKDQMNSQVALSGAFMSDIRLYNQQNLVNVFGKDLKLGSNQLNDVQLSKILVANMSSILSGGYTSQYLEKINGLDCLKLVNSGGSLFSNEIKSRMISVYNISRQ